MKVVYILSSAKATGGASKAFLTLLMGLMEKGVEPIAVLPGRGAFYDVLQSRGIPCIILIYRNCTYPYRRNLKETLLFLPRLCARLWVNFFAARALTKRLKCSGVALIHTNVGVVDIGFRAAQKLHVPHIYHIREYADLDFGMHYFPTKASFRRQLQKNDSYSICITRDIQQHHAQQTSSSSRVIYDGITLPAVPGVSSYGGDYFLYAGRIEPAKGLDILLRAYVLCRRRGKALPQLWVAGRVGQPAFMDEVSQFIAKHDLSHTVRFLGEREDVVSLMQQARALIVPSRHEGFGLCMPEAMHVHCLVIAHDTAGTQEQLDNGLAWTGGEIALRFNSPEQLVDRLCEVLTTPMESFEGMKGRAYKAVTQLYTPEATVEQVWQYYKDILKTDKRS